MGRKQRNDGYEKVTDLVSIWRRGRTWYAYYAEGGKARRPSLGTKYVEQARKAAMEIDEGLRSGDAPACEDMEIQALFARHLEYLETQGRRGSTLKRYRAVFERFAEFCEAKGVTKAGRVGMALVEDFSAERAGQGMADGTRYREAQWIKQVWKYAEERNLIPANCIKGMKLRKPNSGEQPCFTEGQVEAILAAAEGQMRSILTVLAYTGLRRGELQWLAWEDVDLEKGWLHVRAKDGWAPKNGKDRKLPIHPKVRVTLERTPRVHRWVFTARRSKQCPNGGGQIHVEHVRERLLRILDRIGIGRGGLHSFRRFFITHCANKGVAPTVLMKWVGHSDLRMILTYYNLQDQESLDAMEAIGGGETFRPFMHTLCTLGVPEKQPQSQTPVFRAVTTAAS